MKRLVLAVLFVLVMSSLALAMNVDSRLVEVMKSGKGLIPVIVEMNPGAKHADVTALGGKLKDSWTVINGFSADLPVAAIEALQKNPNVRAVSYDGTLVGCMDVAAPTITADQNWVQGYDGDGVTVAIVDSGIYPHQDLATRIVGFKDFINARTSAYDDNGHGTHLAGVVAGNGATYKGIAPHAKLIGVKVLDATHTGTFSTIISGINWVVNNKATYGIKVLVLALSGTVTQSSSTDPVCAAVRSAWNAGLVVCVAAGNAGPNAITIGTPGNEPLILTVGSTWDRNVVNPAGNTIASFSSRGPTPIDGWTKPNCVAPGSYIISLKNAATGYVSMSGTSMSAAMVAGIAAQFFELYPTASPATVKTRIIGSGISLGEPSNTQGSGLVDAYYALH